MKINSRWVQLSVSTLALGASLVACTSGGRLTIQLPPPKQVIPPPPLPPPPPPARVLPSLGLGESFTCATIQFGTYCWGLNDYGQIGVGAPASPATHFNSPQAVNGLDTGIKAVYAGFDHACATHLDGRVYCWGSGSHGQLGNNPTVVNPYLFDHYEIAPVQATTITRPMDRLSLGEQTTCGIHDQKVYCMGNSSHGVLGSGSSGDQNHPLLVRFMNSGVTSISVGIFHACAVKDGKVYCWGRNNFGQLGDNSFNRSDTPVEVHHSMPGLVQEVRVGDDFSCALLRDHSVYCWGHNNHGQLGNRTFRDSPVPVEVLNIDKKATLLATGAFHACAETSGELKCWGLNDQGQLGDNSITSRNIPVQVHNLPASAEVVGLGAHHSCAWLVDSSLYCWGNNASGQLGDSTYVSRHTPVHIPKFWP